MDIDKDGHGDSDIVDLYDAIHVPLPEGCHSSRPEEQPVPADAPAFRRWVSILRKRHIRRRRGPHPGVLGGSEKLIDIDASMLSPPVPGHVPSSPRPCSVSSSMGCIMVIRSASTTEASTSIAPHSERAGLQPKARMGKRSSTFSEIRKSTDSNATNLGPILDESAWLRSVQRRKIVEEIISSEESYIGDLKVLINVSSADYLCSVPG